MPIILRLPKKNTRPIDRMSNKELETYVSDMLDGWPVKLNIQEKVDLFRIMWNSVTSMKLKCMSQKERDAYYASRRKKAKVCQDVKTQIKERHNKLKIHVIDV